MDRRQLFKHFSLGTSGVLLAPLTQRLAAEQSGTYAPRRFVFVVEGNGFSPGQAQPKTIPRTKHSHGRNNEDRLIDVSLEGHALPEALKPLEPFKDRMAIVQGLSGRVCGGGHSNDFGALGVYSSKAGAYGQTIDMALAQALPATFNQVGLGISDRPEHSIIYNTSAIARGKKVPCQCRPDLAYQQLFGSVLGGDAAKSFHAKTNLLDFMVDDVQRVSKQLDGSEREKLDQYLGAFESMRDRQVKLKDSQSLLKKHAPTTNDKYTSPVETDRLEAHFDMGAAALISGLTNVLTIASGAGNPYFSVKFTGLGIDFGKHSIGHGGSYQGMTSEQMSIKIRKFHFQQIAQLAKRLDDIPEGNGSMLDNTAIVYLSDAAEGHHSRCWEWPMVVLGGLGGRLKTNGRFLNYPKYGGKGHRTIANMYTTFLHAAGAPQDHFGLQDPNLRDLDQNGPLAELLA